MATLLKLDSKIINLDTVFEINDYGDRIRVYYAVPSCDPAGTQQPSYAEVDGLPAELLRRWLSRHCIDLMAELSGEERETIERQHQREQVAASAVQAMAEQARDLHSDTPAPAAEDDQPYGATRIRQMSGAGDSAPSLRRRAAKRPREREISG
jgi:hypothetical protein